MVIRPRAGCRKEERDTYPHSEQILYSTRVPDFPVTPVRSAMRPAANGQPKVRLGKGGRSFTSTRTGRPVVPRRQSAKCRRIRSVAQSEGLCAGAWRCRFRLPLPGVRLPHPRVLDHGDVRFARCPCAVDRLAYAGRDRAVRLPVRHDQLRAARGARILSDAAVAGERLGPRRVRLRDRDPEHPVGPRPAVCGRACRPLRSRPGAVGGGDPLRHRPRHDGVCDHAAHARPFGRRLHRLRSCRLRVQYRAVGVRQAAARAISLVGIWRGRGRRLLRPVSLLAARGLAY